jgi:Flp pilus assembly protein TadG
MMIRKPSRLPRRGHVAAEAAICLSILLSLAFGTFEFSRVLMVRNLLNNAAREGCRYAIANNTDPAINTEVQTIVTNFMAGQTLGLTNLTVSVSGTHQGVSTAVNSLAAADIVTVQVSGTFHFMNIIPLFKMPSSISMASSVIMTCEGGM